ncbi:hypothetical protein DBV15_08601 [Temnothorax longispinosus]|uniref:Uncharacterized protein n=1 Tax=Temnothorax longispinosus TaxID=300112 RepID=A0A4S2KQA0_9HYME|nr:hypothetical protein DBV15_08601 [Temnothorax longispinosus]
MKDYLVLYSAMMDKRVDKLATVLISCGTFVRVASSTTTNSEEYLDGERGKENISPTKIPEISYVLHMASLIVCITGGKSFMRNPLTIPLLNYPSVTHFTHERIDNRENAILHRTLIRACKRVGEPRVTLRRTIISRYEIKNSPETANKRLEER